MLCRCQRVGVLVLGLPNHQTTKSIEPPNSPISPAPPSQSPTMCNVYVLSSICFQPPTVRGLLWNCRFGLSFRYLYLLGFKWASFACRYHVQNRAQILFICMYGNVLFAGVCGLWHFLARQYACNLSTHEIFRCLPYLSTSCIICTFVLLIKDILDIFLVWPYLASQIASAIVVMWGMPQTKTRRSKKKKNEN